ncbi:hypothetical protein PSCICM_50640 [Pseudomonas cichorii]|nr:hypothetical protein PSCICM_50640 [Pseudomonas cichorii]
MAGTSGLREAIFIGGGLTVMHMEREAGVIRDQLAHVLPGHAHDFSQVCEAYKIGCRSNQLSVRHRAADIG